jgi:hypothetical protein
VPIPAAQAQPLLWHILYFRINTLAPDTPLLNGSIKCLRYIGSSLKGSFIREKAAKHD